MTQDELKHILNKLRELPKETEWLEFKEAKNSFSFKEIGQYFSAFSNEANLKKKECGWLIFGIGDKQREIVGTNYRPKRADLDNLKYEVASKTTNRITFIEIHELYLPEGRVIMFQIPATPPGIPVAWEGHYFGREGESLGPLNLQEIEQIRHQAKKHDWSALICEEASLDDLEPKAIVKAREEFKKKFPAKVVEVDSWDDLTFLNKAKVTIKGKITRTAIILLGKEDSEHFLSPSIAKISWILKDEHNIEKDYEHFAPPFILNTDAVFAKIRNLKYRYLLDHTLFPTEITQYEPYVIREALHNCIAHQDYELAGKITVVEKPDELFFTNLGSFLPESVEKVIDQDAPQEYYRNHFLSTAMVNLNMIDTIGSGIKRMFTLQRKRFFPMPDYDLTEQSSVKVKVIGKVIDENYTRTLIANTDIDLKSVIYLDKVQKREKISKEAFAILKKQRLIEGRYPNIYVSAGVAAVTGEKTKYIKYRAFDKEYYMKLVLDYLKKYKSASRKDIDDLLLDKLSNILDEQQKLNKIKNLIYELSKKSGSIRNIGTLAKPKWILTPKSEE